MKSFQKPNRTPPPKTPRIGQTPGQAPPWSQDFIPNNRKGRRARAKQRRR